MVLYSKLAMKRSLPRIGSTDPYNTDRVYSIHLEAQRGRLQRERAVSVYIDRSTVCGNAHTNRVRLVSGIISVLASNKAALVRKVCLGRLVTPGLLWPAASMTSSEVRRAWSGVTANHYLKNRVCQEVQSAHQY